MALRSSGQLLWCFFVATKWCKCDLDGCYVILGGY